MESSTSFMRLVLSPYHAMQDQASMSTLYLVESWRSCKLFFEDLEAVIAAHASLLDLSGPFTYIVSSRLKVFCSKVLKQEYQRRQVFVIYSRQEVPHTGSN